VTTNAVLVIGTGTGTVIGTIPVGATSAVVALNGSKLYVPQAPNSVLAFETETYALIDTITLQPLDCK
jgi:DNA-binding beta-propeller fold protein YncE